MTNHHLIAKAEVATDIAKLATKQPIQTGYLQTDVQPPVHLKLEVREHCCFKSGKWVSIGDITIHPMMSDPVESPKEAMEQAVQHGSYEWRLPDADCLQSDLSDALQTGKDGDDDATKHRIEAASKAVCHIATRCGFVSPLFDAMAVSSMPFRRPATVVADTTSVIQGALDFVTRFLCPAARIKIPAIVHMEILNFVDRFFSGRRRKQSKQSKQSRNLSRILCDHVLSQGGQRTLLRLELHADVEIERPRLGADPLRGIVQPSSDSEDKNLGLQEIIRSFADRLILETAIQHRQHVNFGHDVLLLTGDQGLARMALAEGLYPLYFDANYSKRLFGKTLGGICFLPFTINFSKSRVYHIPLADLLWESAVTFGSARLLDLETERTITVTAIDESLSWQPFHSRDDLLWVALTEVTPKGPVESRPVTAAPGAASKVSVGAFEGSYSFRVDSMIHLIDALNRHDAIEDSAAMKILGIKTSKRFREYSNFLIAGSFATRSEEQIQKTELLDTLCAALRNRAWPEISKCLEKVPSFERFIRELEVGTPMPRDSISSISKSAYPTYRTLAEIACATLEIPEKGLYATPTRPDVRTFSQYAIQAYESVSAGEEYILVGEWLEYLVQRHGIHPIIARERLEEARTAGYLERYTEGSTPETQFGRHNMSCLDVKGSDVSVMTINLYEGGFIIPGKASVSILLQEPSNGPS